MISSSERKMRCIYCKENSDNSRSVQHIIPEALGNVDHTLPPKVVCDKCNNYLSNKIEKPFLESPAIVQARHRMHVENKKKLVPAIQSIHLQTGILINIGQHEIYPHNEKDFDRFIRSTMQYMRGTLVVPTINPTELMISKFVCKVAYEALALRFIEHQIPLDEIIDNVEIQPFRQYIRYGVPTNKIWEIHVRQLYEENRLFREEDENYELLHEFNFHRTKDDELLFLLVIFGIEYAVSLERFEAVGYKNWLAENNQASPLYPDGII